MGGGGGADASPLLSLLLVDQSQRNFAHGLTIIALVQIWRKYIKLMTS